MRVLRSKEEIASLLDGTLRTLIQQRIAQIEGCCPWSAEELGPVIVVEPGDSVQALEAEIGLPVLRSLFDEVPFGNDDFVPGFEWVESLGDAAFEMVFIVSDSGAGYDIFILNQPGVDPDLLALCQAYATPACI